MQKVDAVEITSEIKLQIIIEINRLIHPCEVLNLGMEWTE